MELQREPETILLINKNVTINYGSSNKNKLYVVLLIDKFRISKGLSKKKLSELSGVSRSTITEIETTNRVPNVLTMVRLAKALECNINDLVLVENYGGIGV